MTAALKSFPGSGDEPKALRSADDIVSAGLANESALGALQRVGERYAIAITAALADVIDSTDPNDPIALQFVPDARELRTLNGELTDPISDHPFSPVPGIVHRYHDRVLLKIAHVCPVYCRFCFRREMVGPGNARALSSGEIANAIAYVREHREIWEVIFTGGDPLVLSPRRVREVVQALGDVEHLKILRWHTRVPIVDPSRITNELIAALRASNKAVVIAVHTNHAREFTTAARSALATLSEAGIMLLSQTVLLKGINDTADALETLMRTLMENRIKPYYLHHGDLAPGTSHMRTTIAKGRDIMRDLRRRLSGHAVPRYVLDIPGGHGKVDIEANVRDLDGGAYEVTDPKGILHHYRDVL